MATSPRRFLQWIRQPEYTGKNRCVPCTVVNLVIAVVLAGVIAIVSPVAALFILLVSLGSIYVRGYLVPGTPTLTKRYFPEWLLAKFDKEPLPATSSRPPSAAADVADGTDPGSGSPAETDPETIFLTHGVLEPCEEIDDLCVVEDVSERWRTEIESVRDGDLREQVAVYLDVDPDPLELMTYKQRTEARVDGRLAAWWESEAALIADLASETILGDVIDEWDSWPLPDRSQLAGGMRAFVETCPSCDGRISVGEETVESCCRSRQIYAVTCEDCDSRILEVAPQE